MTTPFVLVVRPSLWLAVGMHTTHNTTLNYGIGPVYGLLVPMLGYCLQELAAGQVEPDPDAAAVAAILQAALTALEHQDTTVRETY